MDHYSILGISHSATDGEIKKAYRELALKHHPDMKNNNAKSASADVFQQIQASYGVLSDPIKRMVYDRDKFGGMSVRTSTFNNQSADRKPSSSSSSSAHYKPLTAEDVNKMFANASNNSTTASSSNRVSAARFQSRVASTPFAQRKAQRVKSVGNSTSSIGWALTVPMLVAAVWGASTWYSHSSTKEREKKRADVINRMK